MFLCWEAYDYDTGATRPAGEPALRIATTAAAARVYRSSAADTAV